MDVKVFLSQFESIGIKILNTSIKDNITTVKIELNLKGNKDYNIEGFGMSQGNTLDSAENAVQNAIERIVNRYISIEKQTSNVIPFATAQEQNNQMPIAENQQQNNQPAYLETGCVYCGFVPSEDAQDYTRRHLGHVVCRDCQRILNNGGTPQRIHYTLQPDRIKKSKKQTS